MDPDKLTVDAMWCACAFMLWFGEARAGGMAKELRKSENEDCPDGYYIGEYPDQCIACSETCYPNMDYYTELSCKYICPDVFKEIINQSKAAMVTTASIVQNPETSVHDDYFNIRYKIITTLASFVAFSFVLCIIGIIAFFIYKHHKQSKSQKNRVVSFRRCCCSRGNSPVNQDLQEEMTPIPIENTEDHGNGHIPGPLIVPSGSSYNDPDAQFAIEQETIV